MLFLKSSFVIFIITTVVTLLLIIVILIIKKKNRTISKEEVIKDLRNKVNVLHNKCIKSGKLILTLTLDQKFDNYLLSRKNKFGNEENVLINFTDSKFSLNSSKLNTIITEYVRKHGGITKDNRWVDFMNCTINGYKNRMGLSNFADKFVVHLVTLDPKNLKLNKLNIEDITRNVTELIKKGVEYFLRYIAVPGRIFYIPLCSGGFIAEAVIDINEIEFSKEEFDLRIELGVWKAFYEYNGRDKIVLIKIPE